MTDFENLLDKRENAIQDFMKQRRTSPDKQDLNVFQLEAEYKRIKKANCTKCKGTGYITGTTYPNRSIRCRVCKKIDKSTLPVVIKVFSSGTEAK